MTTAAASGGSLPSRAWRALPSRDAATWLYLLVALLAALHVSMALGRSINWDEFWFYSQVEQVARGEAIQPLQTIHTRAFAWWLPQMAGSEIDHILLARLFMLACLAATSTAIYLVAEKLVDRRSALIALAAYLGAGFVLHHGAAFRVDPIVTACLASALAIAARTRLSPRSIIALGALVGLAAMVTIKMVLWLPAFAGIALYRWEEHGFAKHYPLRWIAAGIVALATFGLLYAAHTAGMPTAQSEQSAQDTLGLSAGKAIGLFDPSSMEAAAKAVLTGLPLVVIAAMVPFLVLRTDASAYRKVALIALWFPVLTPLFYFNAHPYFYAFILPPVAASAALAVPVLLRRYGHAALIAAVAGSALMVWAVDPRGVTDRQQELVDAVHDTFPEPVAYFDCCGMIGGFEKANNFRTQWGVEIYRDSRRPQLFEAMRQRPVPLLLDNNREFSRAISGAATETFHPDDVSALRSTYVRLWGDIFVAGREVPAGGTQRWTVLVPGPYTLEGGRVLVDGEPVASGETVTLERGTVTLTNPGDKSAALLWGTAIRRPSALPPEQYWTAF